MKKKKFYAATRRITQLLLLRVRERERERKRNRESILAPQTLTFHGKEHLQAAKPTQKKTNAVKIYNSHANKFSNNIILGTVYLLTREQESYKGRCYRGKRTKPEPVFFFFLKKENLLPFAFRLRTHETPMADLHIIHVQAVGKFERRLRN